MNLIDWICLGVCILHTLFSVIFSPLLSKKLVRKYCDQCGDYKLGDHDVHLSGDSISALENFCRTLLNLKKNTNIDLSETQINKICDFISDLRGY